MVEFNVINLDKVGGMMLIRITQNNLEETKKMYIEPYGKVEYSETFPYYPGIEEEQKFKINEPFDIFVSMINSEENFICTAQVYFYKPSCSDECSTNTCKGFNFVECTLREDGCYRYMTHANLKIGKCGVECESNNDCSSNEECKNHKCEKEVCSELIVAKYCDGFNLKADKQMADCSVTHPLIELCQYGCINSPPSSFCYYDWKVKSGECQGKTIVIEYELDDGTITEISHECENGCDKIDQIDSLYDCNLNETIGTE